MKTFALASLVLGSTGLAAAAEICGARCGSEVGFTSSNGPELSISYDGARLTVPQHCREEDCATNAKEIAGLNAQVAGLTTENQALRQLVAAVQGRMGALETKQAADHHFVLTKAFMLDGGWSDWGTFSSCSTACGDGAKIRQRTCTNPAPKQGGADCAGPVTDSATCNIGVCDKVRDVTCAFTVDNYIQEIYVDGVDITAKVSGALHDWPSKKTYTFPSSARSFSARVNDAEAGCNNGGFAIKCTTSGTGGGAQWNMDSNQRDKWRVASSPSWDTPSADSSGHKWYENAYHEGSRWGKPRNGLTSYADSVIGVGDMCGPEHEPSNHNKWFFRFNIEHTY